MKTKFIFVTGGVVSSLGKGIAAASIAALLENRGLKITMLKLDPYINVDAGTMNPFQHGEVFVLDDGAETDLDLGHYERFTHSQLCRDNNITTGKIYHSVIEKERKGEYLGKTVQVVPHITDEIKASLLRVSKDVDLVIVEIGGTVGDIESLPFLEAIRQFRYVVGEENVLYVHLTLVPYIGAAGELKTKPTQHSVQKLREIGIQPDLLLCRTDRPLSKDIKAKIGMFCNISPNAVFNAPDVDSIYEVPLVFHQEGVDEKIVERLNIWTRKPELKEWKDLVDQIKNLSQKITIAIVGKYVDLVDSYKSLNEALKHGGYKNAVQVNLKYIDSEELEKNEATEVLEGIDGILVPGGFGDRGIEGKIAAVKYARENKIPFFGICLGMQIACIEFARNVVGLEKANSREFDPESPHPVIDLMEGQKAILHKGGSMRLGAYPCTLEKGSLAAQIYGEREISERHRHRYEFNNAYREKLSQKGFKFSGLSPDGSLVEIIELPGHPYFVACQFHPEFKSRPMAVHPLFDAFVSHSLAYARREKWEDLKKDKREATIATPEASQMKKVTTKKK
ncbi:MAG: CTP synthase [Deltaproteobacteria bacterium]|nr:CTP synthase [Deltaproteobacteria bacterium]